MAFSAHSDPEMVRERFDQQAILDRKVSKLAKWIQESKHCVVFTGAGISTSAGISDFRGPEGVWTRKAKGLKPKASASTISAIPTTTHMALVELQRRNIVKYLISQNCDGLHKRSGIHPDRISELHGNSNIEECENCKRQYLRDFVCYRLGRGRDHYTGRHCVVPNCNGRLLEYTIDFGQNLPEEPMEKGFAHADKADLHIVFGSSLTVSPACNMPEMTAKNGKRLVICNLQKTPLDHLASMNIHGRCDVIMNMLMSKLDIPIPEWRLRRDLIVYNIKPSSSSNLPLLYLRGADPDDASLPASICRNVQLVRAPQTGTPGNATLNDSDDEDENKHGEAKIARSKRSEGRRVLVKAMAPPLITPCNGNELGFYVQFMGHYSEPNLFIELPKPVQDKISTTVSSFIDSDTKATRFQDSKTTFHLVYNPFTMKWKVDTDTEPLAPKEKRSELHLLGQTVDDVTQQAHDLELQIKEVEANRQTSSYFTNSPSSASSNGLDDHANQMPDDFASEFIAEFFTIPESKATAFTHQEGLWSRVVASIDEKEHPCMYVIGGAPSSSANSDNNSHGSISKFDCYDGVWQPFQVTTREKDELPFLHKPRWGHSACQVMNNSHLVYMFGGWDSTSQYNDMYYLNLKTKQLSTVQTKGKQPSFRANHSMTAISPTQLLCFGGAVCNGGPYQYFNDVHLFDISTNTWTELKCTGEKPLARSQHEAHFVSLRPEVGETERSTSRKEEKKSMAQNCNFLVVIGGYNGNKKLADVYVMDLHSLEWTRIDCTSRIDGGDAPTESLCEPQNFRVRPATHSSLKVYVNDSNDHSSNKLQRSRQPDCCFYVQGLGGNRQQEPCLLSLRLRNRTGVWQPFGCVKGTKISGTNSAGKIILGEGGFLMGQQVCMMPLAEEASTVYDTIIYSPAFTDSAKMRLLKISAHTAIF